MNPCSCLNRGHMQHLSQTYTLVLKLSEPYLKNTISCSPKNYLQHTSRNPTNLRGGENELLQKLTHFLCYCELCDVETSFEFIYDDPNPQLSWKARNYGWVRQNDVKKQRNIFWRFQGVRVGESFFLALQINRECQARYEINFLLPQSCRVEVLILFSGSRDHNCERSEVDVIIYNFNIY
ncbi:unnamed protein product [Paramecium primaurelia]|uniref:Uncharacterized protein n=1 Tax=Paramecium primaurelia TaxID=5886 RepID=A0A8S1NUM0_PARPR|nr:unnamed protein product [Paramecium primaurelia]CAD8095081.1 unnamed protein product [Paramecium primaurelia]